MAKYLTDAFLGTLRRAEGRAEVVDEAVSGLRVRRTKRGELVWSFWYRRRDSVGGTRYRLGVYSPDPGRGLTLAAARKKARDLGAKIDAGGDPQRELQARRAAEMEKRRAPKPDSVADLLLKALPNLKLRPTTRSEWTRRVQTNLLTAPFASKSAIAVAPHEVEEWLAKIALRSGHSANGTRTVLLRCYSWAVQKKLLPMSPVAMVEKPDPDADAKRSERVLSRDELRAILLALDEFEHEGFSARVAYAQAARLLLLTGVRRSAVLGMTRTEVEALGSAEARWVVPSARSKNGRPHVVPLCPWATSIIADRLRRAPGLHLFPQYKTESESVDTPMTWSSKFATDLKKRTDKQLGRAAERWKVHGFRSALATHCRESLKVSGDVVSLLLSHTPPGASITRVYDRSELLEERRAALAAWEVLLRRVVTGETGQVVELRRA